MPSTDAPSTPKIPGLPDLTAEGQAQVDELVGRLNDPAVVSAKKQGTTKAVTTAKEWRKKRTEGIVVELPSGNAAKIVRKMDIVEMMRNGELPNSLSTIVMGMMSGDTTAIEALTMDQEMVLNMMDWINDQVIAAMVEPRVVRKPITADMSPAESQKAFEDAGWTYDAAERQWDPPEGSIEIVDVDMQDRMFICGITQGGPADYDSFRTQSEHALAAAQRGQGVQPAS